MSDAAAKRAAAGAALAYVEDGELLGVGSGSTVNEFISCLASHSARPSAAMAASIQSAEALMAIGIPVVLAPPSGTLEVYVDGADEVDAEKHMIKGGGGAHTREKAIASIAERFVCIVDESKVVERLGVFPVAIEVVPTAVGAVTSAIRALGADATLRPHNLTDTGNAILDATGLDLSDPPRIEDHIESISGVLGCGVFGHRRADVVIVGCEDGSHYRLP